MRFDKERVGDVVVVRVREKQLTSHEAPEMKTVLLKLILEEGEVFLLNLKEVERIDSTGLGSFLFGIRQADAHGKEMVFCEIQSKVQFLIRIAHLQDVIEVYDTEEEALKNLQKEDVDK